MSKAKKYRVGISSWGIAASTEEKRIIRRAVEAALAAEGVDKPCAVEVYTTGDAGIHSVNLTSRGIDRPTDVLSFPMLELRPGEQPDCDEFELDEQGRIPLGEMVVSLERAKAQAEEYGHSFERELSFLVVHSILHLLGYDHERGEADEKLHFSRQEEILNEMGINRGN